MIIRSAAWRSGFAMGAVFLALLVISCGSQPPPATLNPTSTPSPTPTGAATSTPTVAPQEENGFNAPDPESLPEAAAPLGLGDVSLPDSAESIAALFNNLPPSLLGGERTIQSGVTTPGEIHVSYGTTQPVGCGTVGLQAMDVSTGDFYPQGWTAEKVVAVFTTGADWNVEDFGRDGELFWVIWNTTCSSEGSPGADSIFTTSWGNAGSSWFFSATAGDSEGRDELTAAFVAASR